MLDSFTCILVIVRRIITVSLIEQQRQKTFLQTRESSEDSDQPAHSRSLIRIFTGRIFMIAKGAKFLHADNEDWSDCADALGAHVRGYVSYVVTEW